MRTIRQRVAFLRGVPGLANCTEPELTALASSIEECEVGAGEAITREGATSPQSFLIAEGSASVRVGDTTVARLGPGSFLGDIGSGDRLPQAATVTADTPMRLLIMTPTALTALTSGEPR